MKKFNVQPTMSAFDMISKVMKREDFLNYEVHRVMLEGKFLQKHCNYLRKVLQHLEDTTNEVLLVTFIGRLALRMPKHMLRENGKEANWDDFQQEEMKRKAAALLVNILIDSGEYQLVSKTKQVDPTDNAGKSFKTELYLHFPGTPAMKELLYGLEIEPGVFYQQVVGDMRLSAEFKHYLSRMSSMAFKTSDVLCEEYLLHGYKLSKDYNSKPQNRWSEPRTKKRRRYRGYAEYIMNHVARLPRFYLPMKYDSRSRMYYVFQLIGVRPQGHLWETLMIDAAEPRVLDKSAIPHLMHIIYVTLHGRCSVEQVTKKFSADDLEAAKNAKPLEATTEDAFGEAILLNKAATALSATIAGEPTSYLFGKDLTNSGLMMAGACFKSSKMLKAANLRNLKTVHDSYTDMQEAYALEGVTRKVMKKICTPMLHGASQRSLLKNVHSAMRDLGIPDNVTDSVDLDYISAANRAAFGPEVENMFAISSWGAVAVNNMRTRLYWRTPDGFKAYHRAHIQYCPVTTYAATAGTKAGFREYRMVADMPLKQQANGMPLHAEGTKAPGTKKTVQVKKMGLYANITHGIDAALLRRIADHVRETGDVMLCKHDDYMAMPDRYDGMMDVGIQFFRDCAENNWYQDALDQIAANCPDLPPLPELTIGKGKVEDSVNFLMP